MVDFCRARKRQVEKKIPPKATISVTINRKMIDFKSFVRRAMLGGKYN